MHNIGNTEREKICLSCNTGTSDHPLKLNARKFGTNRRTDIYIQPIVKLMGFTASS